MKVSSPLLCSLAFHRNAIVVDLWDRGRGDQCWCN